MIQTDILIPKNCHECDSIGIRDIVRMNCPCKDIDCYDFDKKPDGCPLKEALTEKEKDYLYEILCK